MDKQRLKIWMIVSTNVDERSFFRQEFQQLERLLGLRIELRFLSWRRAYGSLVKAYKENETPDIFGLGSTWVHPFAYLGYLDPVPQSFRMQQVLAPWITKCIFYQNRQYAVPLTAESMALMARADVLDALNVNAQDLRHWSGLLDTCKYLASLPETDREKLNFQTPMAFPIRPEIGTFHRCAAWMMREGWQFPDLSSLPSTLFADQVCLNVFQQIGLLFQACHSTVDEARLHPLMMYERSLPTNQYVFYLGNGSEIVVDTLDKDNLNHGDLIALPLPSLSGSQGGYGGGTVLCVSARSKIKNIAWQGIEYMQSDRFISKLAEVSGLLPAYKCKFWERNRSNPQISFLESQIRESVSYSFHPIWRAVEDALGTQVSQLLWNLLQSPSSFDKRNLSDALVQFDEHIQYVLRMAWELYDHD